MPPLHSCLARCSCTAQCAAVSDLSGSLVAVFSDNWVGNNCIFQHSDSSQLTASTQMRSVREDNPTTDQLLSTNHQITLK